ncbi:hypothetical protein J1N35_021567 [Gossypium stocksii]|uniref:Uncharacterized protein n=1 Tax=Gossypium stocksii TaxID=47602 RepID=A0A9D3VER5_9ROSI|nr:hypothetical protein J1N35_021567 [Gossypium stocksii]
MVQKDVCAVKCRCKRIILFCSSQNPMRVMRFLVAQLAKELHFSSKLLITSAHEYKLFRAVVETSDSYKQGSIIDESSVNWFPISFMTNEHVLMEVGGGGFDLDSEN